MGDAPCDSHRSRDTSRGCTAWASIMAANMAGTAMAHVIRSCSTMSSTAPGSKAGTTMFDAPTHITARAAYTPAAWNMGAIVR